MSIWPPAEMSCVSILERMRSALRFSSASFFSFSRSALRRASSSSLWARRRSSSSSCAAARFVSSFCARFSSASACFRRCFSSSAGAFPLPAAPAPARAPPPRPAFRRRAPHKQRHCPPPRRTFPCRRGGSPWRASSPPAPHQALRADDLRALHHGGMPSSPRNDVSASPTPSSMIASSALNAGFSRNACAATRTAFSSVGV